MLDGGGNMRLNRYHWGMTLGAAGLVGLAAYPVYDFLVRNKNEYEAAGSFFNFAYGVPIAAVTAVITLAVAWVGHTIASQQGDIEILTFVEERVLPALGHHRKLAVALGETVRVGDQARGISRRILNCLPLKLWQEPNVETDTFVGVLGELSARADALGIEEILSAHRDDIRRWAASRLSEQGEATPEQLKIEEADIRRALVEVGEAVQTLHRAICNINDAFEGISGDLYAAMFSRAALKSNAPGGNTPVRWLKGKLKDQDLRADLLEDSLPDLNGNLRYLSEQTVARELVTAVLSMPDDAGGLEMMGAIVLNYDPSQTAEPGVALFADPEIASMRFNLGAAYYRTAYLYIPGPETVREIFAQILKTTGRQRRQVAVALLDQALPGRSELGIARLAEIMAVNDDVLNRLIVVERRGEEAAFFDPKTHGDRIWKRDPPTQPRALSIRGLFNNRRQAPQATA